MSLALARYRGHMAERKAILKALQERLAMWDDHAKAGSHLALERIEECERIHTLVFLLPRPPKPRSRKRKRAGGSR